SPHQRRQPRWVEIRLCGASSAAVSSPTLYSPDGDSSSRCSKRMRVGSPSTRKNRAYNPASSSSAVFARAAPVPPADSAPAEAGIRCCMLVIALSSYETYPHNLIHIMMIARLNATRQETDHGPEGSRG